MPRNSLMPLVPAAVVLVGAFTLAAVLIDNAERSAPPKSHVWGDRTIVQQQLRGDELDPYWHSFTITPGDIALSVRNDIAKECWPFDAIACTFTGRQPCMMVLPPMRIVYHPGKAQAHFALAEDAETVAHELLHCYVPNWHETFDKAPSFVSKPPPVGLPGR